MGTKNYNRLKRKAQRDEGKIIESILHPCPSIGDIEILHRHAGQYIEFEAWKGGDPLFPIAERRSIRIHKGEVLYKTPYLSERDIAWLVGVLN